MAKTRFLGWNALAFFLFFPVQFVSGSEPVTIKMKPVASEVSGEKPIQGLSGLLGRLFLGNRSQPMQWQGSLSIDGKLHTFFLPEAKTYSTDNPSKQSWQQENKSSQICIDANADGNITIDERWFSNLPVRFGNRMFDVTRLARDGSQLTLAPSKAPLSGLVLGKKCPPFSFLDEDKKTRSLDQYRGKILLVDVWSIT